MKLGLNGRKVPIIVKINNNFSHNMRQECANCTKIDQCTCRRTCNHLALANNPNLPGKTLTFFEMNILETGRCYSYSL